MRTTLDIDDALLARVQALFPPGTPKTVLIEEGLRRLLVAGPWSPAAPPSRRDPRLQRLIDQGRLTPATLTGPAQPPPAEGRLPLAQLLLDLAGDREDR